MSNPSANIVGNVRIRTFTHSRTPKLLFGAAAAIMLLHVTPTYSADIGKALTKSVRLEVDSTAAVIADDAVITDSEIRSFLKNIPEADRARFLADPKRLAESLQGMADTEQLALAGMEQGLLEDEMVSAELYRNVAAEIARKHMTRVVESQRLDDYTQRARELYLANPQQFQKKAGYTFTHLLITTSNRSESEVMRMVIEVLDKLESGTAFDELVAAHSEDPSLSENNGKYEGVTLDSLSRNFANSLEELEPNEISEPVRSRNGWHLIRLEEVSEPGRQSWEEAREKAIEMARSQHAEQIRKNYTSQIVDVSRVEIAPNLAERYQEEFGASGQ